jgi:Ca2+-binding EF-hand superfamily protein
MANSGSAQLKIEKVNAHVTSEEIEKMKWYGIEDDSGAVDHKEYVILILVRIGAISPEIISVLHDRFDQLDEEKCGEITYEKLRGSGSAEGSRNDDQSSTSPV